MRKIAAFVSALVGLFASAYLTWAYLSPTHRMVCLGTGCDKVRESKYAVLWGHPLPLYGLAFYLVLVAVLLLEAGLPKHAKRIRQLLLMLTAGGVLFSAWLTSLEAFVIHAWCEWCVTQAIAVTLAFLFSFWLVLKAPKERGRELRWRLLVLAVAIVVGTPALRWVIKRESTQPAGQIYFEVKVDSRSAALSHADSYGTGPEDAPLTIVEFGDFECPSCGLAEKTNQEIRARYSNQVRFVFRQFPLEKPHPYAMQAAKASECAGQQGKFWAMAEALYAHQSDLTDPALRNYARQTGVDGAKFDVCMMDPAVLGRIRKDQAEGTAFGVRATPTFFLNGKKIEGGLSLSDVEQALHDAQEAHGLAANKDETALPPVRGRAESSPEPRSVPDGKATLPVGKKSADVSATATGKPAASGSGLIGGSHSLFSTPKVSGAMVPCGVDEAPVQDPPLIHVADMQKLLQEKSAAFVDVRGSEAFRQAHIPTAMNATLLQLGEKIPAELSKSKPVVLYEAGGADESCATSRTAGRILMENGFKDVKVFKEGLEGWKKQGLPLAP